MKQRKRKQMNDRNDINHHRNNSNQCYYDKYYRRLV